MRTEQIKIYQFAELSEEAKETAKGQYYYDDFWASDRLNSMKAAQELYNLLDIEAELTGVRLYKFIVNNILPRLKLRIKYTLTGNRYPSNKIYQNEKARFSKIQFEEDPINLTGYCADYDFLEPIFDFLSSPDKHTTNYDLLNIDLEQIYKKLAQTDYEDFFEDEQFKEHCDANGYEFTEDGKRY